ncbi:uncharacterized protein LOC143198954 [Rhynchophorus ferrugineus]|uniref:Uncharacterized protein n=1 Tax=Rhynchophorus ferrugineus TaxID=354439 RepID=A0A834MAF0_RHYFE|nr:hypothetical protein GWI33_014682 [Rhynchophorus ferrugineus]
MFEDEDSLICLEEIAKDLNDIEQKYSSEENRRCLEIPTSLNDNLIVLSKELDSLGLPALHLEGSVIEILNNVAQSSRNVVHIYRNAVCQIKDQNIEKKSKDIRNNEAYLQLDRYKEELDKSRENCAKLKNEVYKLEKKICNFQKKESDHKDEIKRVKTVYASKQHELEHSIRKLKKENDHLKEIFNQDIVKDSSRNNIALALLKKYRVNEEVYHTTIKKLQDNNRELLEEVLSLKEELILKESEN